MDSLENFKDMKNIWKLMAAIAIIGGLAACKKDKGPDAPTDFSGGCEAVDLGLSVKWASYNIGAFNAEGLGAYFAWGETTEKYKYDWAKEGDYKWGVYDMSLPERGMTKYTADVEGGDGLKTLQPGDDPATANWGTKWRTPTYDEIKELFDDTKCEWTWDVAKNGYTIKGLATGKSIFLPAAGSCGSSGLTNVGIYGFYWSSSLGDKASTAEAYGFNFFWGFHDGALVTRCKGRTVRAVTEY